MEINLTDLNDTRRLASQLAPLLALGGVVLLSGRLGAGKTTLVQALCRELGVAETVASPTFDLLHIYRAAQLTVYHVDGYRIVNERDWDVLDLPPPEAPSTLILAEWADALKAWYPDHLEIQLDLDPAMSRRRADLKASGPEWAAKLQTLRDGGA